MEGYLGETRVDIADTEYKDYTPADWAMLWIEKYGGIDGGHHKTWVLDQIARILKGTPVTLRIAKWDNGYTEERFCLAADPSEDYMEWVRQMTSAEDGEDVYEWDEGIAP